MIVLVGLGNPGDKYMNNRHNIGFMALDEIADFYGFPAFKSKFQGLYAEGRIDGKKVGLLKPGTYMNESGRSLAEVSKFYKLGADQVIVMHDELDLDPGKVRVRTGGGNAGHNGLKSIQAHMNSAEFVRVRIGIGHPGDKSRVSGYVLGDFSKADYDWIAPLLPALAKHIPILLSGTQSDYMSKVVMDVK